MMNVKLFTKTVDSKVSESNPHLLAFRQNLNFIRKTTLFRGELEMTPGWDRRVDVVKKCIVYECKNFILTGHIEY